MSDWIGPNVYRITSYKDRTAAVAETDSKKAEDGKVCVRSKDKNQADQWQFVHAGTGVSGKEEFVIINRFSGLYLTSAEGATFAHLHVTRVSPTHHRTRWNLAPTRNGTGTYRIVAAQNNKMMVVTHGEETADETVIQLWQGNQGSKGTWWYLELVDGTALQSADIGKANKP